MTQRITVFLIAILLTSLSLQTVHLGDANPSISLDSGPTPDLSLIPPIISVYSPTNGTFYNTSSLVLAFNASVTYPSPSTDIVEGWWTYYAADWMHGTGDKDTILIDQQSSVTSKEYSINLTDIPEGNHTLAVYVTSYAESGHYANSATSQSMIDFSIDYTPPRITRLSVENKTYETSNLALDFAVDEATSKLTYSLDGKDAVTVEGNTILQGYLMAFTV
jgi:hypothetical protein